jgi:hypothetical protein
VWARAIKSGKTVDVVVELTYDNDGRRPTVIRVDYAVDGQPRFDIIRNPDLKIGKINQ